MNEIKKTLLTIKVHGFETAFAIFLFVFAYAMVLVPNILNIKSPVFSVVLLICCLGPTILACIYFYGFQRSIHLEANDKLTIMDLMKIGKSFFWRMIGFRLLTIGVIWILGRITSFIVRGSIPIEVHFAFQLILMKPMILIPAAIIALDSKLIDSFTLLKHYKLLEAKELIAVFLLMLCVHCFWRTFGTFGPYFPIVFVMVEVFVILVIRITAMRFVASQALNDENERNSDLEEDEQDNK